MKRWLLIPLFLGGCVVVRQPPPAYHPPPPPAPAPAPAPPPPAPPPRGYGISHDQAAQIAVNYAAGQGYRVIRVEEVERHGHQPFWKVELDVDGGDLRMKIDATSGAVLQAKAKREKHKHHHDDDDD